MILLDNFHFAVAIHTGLYASFDNISFIIYFIKSVYRDNCSCLKSDLLFNCFHAATFPTFFAYWFHNIQGSYRGKSVSCLDTTESHLECNALLLQLSCYEKSLNLFHENIWSYCVCLWKPMAWLQEVDYILYSYWDRNRLYPFYSCDIFMAVAIHTGPYE